MSKIVVAIILLLVLAGGLFAIIYLARREAEKLKKKLKRGKKHGFY